MRTLARRVSGEGLLAIVRCQTCGLMFTEPQPKHEEIVALYSESYFHSDDARSMAYDDYLADGENILRSSRRRLERIEQVLGTRGQISSMLAAPPVSS